MIFSTSTKVVMAFWPGIYCVFGPAVPKSAFWVFRSGPKRCAAKSYADSWWYHLGKCLLCPFRAHLRFSFSGHFWRSGLFSDIWPPEKVYTNCFRQPYDDCDNRPRLGACVWCSLVFFLSCQYFTWDRMMEATAALPTQRVFLMPCLSHQVCNRFHVQHCNMHACRFMIF